MRFISAVSGYLPMLRLDRSAATIALRWSGLGRGVGHRSVAGWDEDAVTIAVEAARSLIDEKVVDRFIFASTSAPFYDRSHATLAIEALALPPATRSIDVAGSRRCGVGALLDALSGAGTAIVAAGEVRRAKAGSAEHLSFGDGGAAVGVGDEGTARLIGHASLAHDLIDMYSSRESPHPYAYEERFVRDTASRKVIIPTIERACAAAGISPSSITHAAVHQPLPRMWRDIAAALCTSALNHAERLSEKAGDLGAAHALFAFGLALASAAPGDIVLLVGFGSGCDALLFEVTAPTPSASAVTDTLSRGVVTQDYVRFLSLSGALDVDWGVRAELDQKAQGTVLERNGRAMMGFIGGRDAAGNVQFPQSKIPVRPGATGAEDMTDVRLADTPATLVSVTADRLNYCPDPPFWFGLVQFENNARVLMELTDATASGFKVGDPLRMRMRIKSHDRRRGFRTYFWKAAHLERPRLEN